MRVLATTARKPPLRLTSAPGFRVATTHIEGAEGRWKQRAKTGMTSPELADALKEELGIAGGASG